MHMALCDTSSRGVSPKKFHVCTSNKAEVLLGEERMVGWLLLTVLPGRGEVGMLLPTSAPSQQCTFRKSRVP